MKSVEFLNQYPDMVEKAKKCKTFEEFMNFSDSNGIKFDDITLKEAYDYLNNDVSELDEDQLDAVAGGANKVQEKLTDEIQEAIKPSKRSGSLKAVSDDEIGDEVLNGNADNLFLDEKNNKWYKLT